MSKKKTLIALISVVVLIAVQVYFLSTYDHFKAEGGLQAEVIADPVDVMKDYARGSKDFDRVMANAIEGWKQGKGDFLEEFSKSNKEILDRPLVMLLNYREISEVSINSSDDEVVKFLETKFEGKLNVAENAFQSHLTSMLNKDVEVISVPSNLTMTASIAGQHDNVAESVFKLPTAELGFYECVDFNNFAGFWNDAVMMFEPESESEPDSISYEDVQLVNLNQAPDSEPTPKRTLGSCVSWVNQSFGIVKDSDKDFIDDLIHSEPVRDAFPREYEFRWSLKSNNMGDGRAWFLYVIRIPTKGQLFISNEDVKSATFRLDEVSGNPVLDITMTEEGTDKWSKLTAMNIGRSIAMCVNDKVFSAPRVMGAITDGRTQISGSGVNELKEIETVLNTKNIEIRPTLSSQTLVKGNPPILNALVQKVLLGLSISLALFLIARLFLKPRLN